MRKVGNIVVSEIGLESNFKREWLAYLDYKCDLHGDLSYKDFSNLIDLKRIKWLMEDEAFIVSNDGKLNEVKDCPKVPLEHQLLHTLIDSDDYGHDIGTPCLPMDDFSPQEEPPDDIKHSSSLQPALNSNRVKPRFMKAFPLHYSQKKEVLSVLDCKERNSHALEKSCIYLLVSSFVGFTTTPVFGS